MNDNTESPSVFTNDILQILAPALEAYFVKYNLSPPLPPYPLDHYIGIYKPTKIDAMPVAINVTLSTDRHCLNFFAPNGYFLGSATFAQFPNDPTAFRFNMPDENTCRDLVDGFNDEIVYCVQPPSVGCAYWLFMETYYLHKG